MCVKYLNWQNILGNVVIVTRGWLCLILLLFVGLNLNAQYGVKNGANFVHKDKSFLFRAETTIEQNATAIPNSLINELYFGEGVITNDMKQIVSDLTKPMNQAGLYYDLNFSAYKSLDNQVWTDQIGVTIGNKLVAGASYSQDLWYLSAYGNKRFEDSTAYLSGTEFSSVSYTYINLDFAKQISEKLTLEYSVGLARVNSFIDLNLTNASIYTAPYGEYLDLTLSYELNHNSSEENLNQNAFGLIFGGALHYEIDDKGSFLRAEISDLGGANWKEAESYTMDSNYRFQGVVLDDVLNPTLGALPELNPDSLISQFGGENSNQSRKLNLPTRFSILSHYTISDKIGVGVRLQTLGLKSYKPLVEIYPEYSINQQISLMANLGRGGFGRTILGLGLNAKLLKEQLIVNLGVSQLNGLLLSKTNSGQGISAQIYYTF